MHAPSPWYSLPCAVSASVGYTGCFCHSYIGIFIRLFAAETRITARFLFRYKKNKVFHDQELPVGESTHAVHEVDYQLLQ